MARASDTGLGSAAITHRSADGVPAVQYVKPRRGWQGLRTADQLSLDDVLVDLSAPPVDARRLPEDGQTVLVRVNGQDSAVCTVQLLFWGQAGAGWSETVVFEDAGVFAPPATPGSPLYPNSVNLSVAIERTRRGAVWIAARIVDAIEWREVQYRVF